jgi:NADPH-dependent glutamate synthase beta subunit-like oxidoreductase
MQGRYADAIRLIRKDNPFPTTCGFICEHPCEARCRRNIVDDAVNIRGLKRVAADFAGEVDPPECAPSTGKRVAIVGGGPGGLSAAYYLQLMGHQVTVFEMLPELGGMLRYGIPNYRLPKERLEEDVRAILKTGVEVKHGLRIGEDITIQSLREEYDAVLITIGASTDKKLGIEGEQSEGVLSAVQFLRDVGKKQNPDLTGQEVAVVGGGNVSMDAVRTARRLGAKKVTILYRRRVADMTALPAEIEGAVAEGIELLTLKAPSRIVADENGRVKGIYVTPQMISKIKDGRASVKATGEEDIFIPCQTLIVAIGQDIEYQHFAEAGVPVERGKIVTERHGGFENIPGVFAGGDCASGPASVIKAIAAAKVVAANIDEYLGYHHIISTDVKIPEARLDDRPPCGRVNLSERESGERVCDFEAVEFCMTEKEAHQESGRCLRCDHFGYGIFKGGREEEW